MLPRQITGRRQGRSISSTPIGGERANSAAVQAGTHPGAIGSSRSNSVHSSPVHTTMESQGTELDAVFPALDMNGAGGEGVLGGAPGGAFLGVY